MLVPDAPIDFLNPTNRPKAWYAGDSYIGQPFALMTDESLTLAGSLYNGIIIDPIFGVGLQGPMSFAASPSDISIGGGYWRFNDQILTCIGSSAALPIPFLVPSTPSLLQSANTIANSAQTMIQAGL